MSEVEVASCLTSPGEDHQLPVIVFLPLIPHGSSCRLHFQATGDAGPSHSVAGH